MRALKYFLFCFTLLSALQCRKIETPEPGQGDPVFWMETSLSGAVQRWVAGQGGYFMQTSYEQDSTGLYLFSGSLEEQGCTVNCLPSIRIIFRAAVRAGNITDSTLYAGAFLYYKAGGGQMNIQYNTVFSGQAACSVSDAPYAYEWDFGDGITSNLASPTHTYAEGSAPLARMTVTSASGYTAISEKRIRLDSLGLACGIGFSVTSVQNGSVMFVELDNEGAYASGYWNTGDSIPGPLILALAQGASLNLCVTGTTFDGCTSTSCQTAFSTFLQGSPYIASCTAGFTYQVAADTVFVPAPEQLGSVIVEYTDADGVRYSSAWGSQDGYNPVFEATSVEPYERNAGGSPTRKMELGFRCQLYREDGQPYSQLAGNGVFAVAVVE